MNISQTIEKLLNSGSSIGDGSEQKVRKLTETTSNDDNKFMGDPSVDVGKVTNPYDEEKRSPTFIKNVSDFINRALSIGDDALNNIRDLLTDAIDSTLDSEYVANLRETALGNALVTVFSNLKNLTAPYGDGVTETTFGTKMENTWYGDSSRSFLSGFAKGSGKYKIKIAKSTPLDSGSERTSIYGNMILGAPFLFNNVSDPGNRTLINTIIKDSRFLSLTPGMPKYNSGASLQTLTNSILDQTQSPNEMMEYLLRNNIDSEKDKRYYTFEPKYEEYFAYLETMLNTVYLKLGLGTEGDDEFNIMSFFDIRNEDGSIKPDNKDVLKAAYRSAIGFFIDGSSSISESVSSQQTSFGGELSSRTNSYSDTFQRMNYITGMGTGGSARDLARSWGIGVQYKDMISEQASDMFSRTGNVFRGTDSILTKLAKSLITIPMDIMSYASSNDLSQIIQSYATTNGMKVLYPELWADSSYSKNINFDISFTSPYGDPASIFKYVYVPFFSLLTFALPRQAAENGLVSPFFIRADVPGLVTSDLAVISDLSWVKGGDNNLWTKDGLPRSIRCTLTITDLYPYLSMTKRLSFLSANPSYTSFLDNMSGLIAVSENSLDDPLNTYWTQLINRVSGSGIDINVSGSSRLWNKYSKDKQKSNKHISEGTRTSVSGNTNLAGVPWLDRI